jgi:hypothetical protein
MGGLGFGQGYFGQYSSGGTLPIENLFASCLETFLVPGGPLRGMSNLAPTRQVVSA